MRQIGESKQTGRVRVDYDAGSSSEKLGLEVSRPPIDLSREGRWYFLVLTGIHRNSSDKKWSQAVLGGMVWGFHAGVRSRPHEGLYEKIRHSGMRKFSKFQTPHRYLIPKAHMQISVSILEKTAMMRRERGISVLS